MEFALPSTNAGERFPRNVEHVLRQAGWFPGRIVTEAEALQWLTLEWSFDDISGVGMVPPNESGKFSTRMFPAAWRALREFGNLSFNSDGPAPSVTEFFINPLKVGWWVGTDGWFLDEWCADGALFPIGETDDSVLAITGRGEVIDNYENLIGNSIDEALTNLILYREFRTHQIGGQESFEEGSNLMELVRRKWKG